MINVEELTIEEKIGQMLMVGINSHDIIKKLDEVILKYKVGGIILYKKNYRNYDELIKVINYIKELNTKNKIPLFIAIDQEGGRVNRLPPEILNIPSANKIANYQKEDLISKSAIITAKVLNKLGFNMNFAPVLDIKRFENNHPLGDRCFSEKIDEVSKCGIRYMKDLKENNIISVIKHFPGHGRTKKDSHFIIPKIKETTEVLEQSDIIPFKEAIKNKADAMLVSHLKIKNFDKINPATMSKKFITKYIRKKLRFNGILITDDMRMKGIQTVYGKTIPILKAFKSGNDIILFKYKKNEKVIDKLISNVKYNKIKEYKINKSIRRILKLKEKYQINNNKIEKDIEFINIINNEISKIREKILNDI